jgi:hypothetical protein
MTYNMAWFSKQNLNLVTCNFVVHSFVQIFKMSLSSSTNLISSQKKCSSCKQTVSLNSFPYSTVKGKTTTQTATCASCTSRKKESRRKGKANKENVNSKDQDPEPLEKVDHTPLTDLTLGDFLRILEQQDDTITLEANVNVSELQGDRKEQADSLASLVWEKMNYRFL